MKRLLVGSRDLGTVWFSPRSDVTVSDGDLLVRAARGAIGLVLLLLLSTPAEGRWRVDVEGGAIVPASNVTLRDGGDIDTDVSTDLTAGRSFAAGGGYSLNDYVEVGGQFQSNFSGLDIGVASDTLQVYSLTAGPRVYLLPATYRFRPWAVGQIGWYRARAEAGFFGAKVEDTTGNGSLPPLRGKVRMGDRRRGDERRGGFAQAVTCETLPTHAIGGIAPPASGRAAVPDRTLPRLRGMIEDRRPEGASFQARALNTIAAATIRHRGLASSAFRGSRARRLSGSFPPLRGKVRMGGPGSGRRLPGIGRSPRTRHRCC
jgi:hypothetical protein